MRAAPRAAVAAATGLTLAAVLSACGDSGGEADVKPAGDPSPTSSSAGSSAPVSPSGSPTAVSTAVVRSGLESEAPVKAARAWASAVATEVNQRSSSHARTKALTTSKGARTLPRTYAGDYGLRYPGPLPFTPLSVSVTGRTAQVPACIQGGGWARNGAGFASRRSVSASTFVLKKRGGQWKLDAITGRQDSCDGVTVKGYSR